LEWIFANSTLVVVLEVEVGSCVVVVEDMNVVVKEVVTKIGVNVVVTGDDLEVEKIVVVPKDAIVVLADADSGNEELIIRLELFVIAAVVS